MTTPIGNLKPYFYNTPGRQTEDTLLAAMRACAPFNDRPAFLLLQRCREFVEVVDHRQATYQNLRTAHLESQKGQLLNAFFWPALVSLERVLEGDTYRTIYTLLPPTYNILQPFSSATMVSVVQSITFDMGAMVLDLLNLRDYYKVKD